MHILKVLLFASCSLSGCSVVKWQAVEANVQPAPAYIRINETGQAYGPVPALIYIRQRFGRFERKAKYYTFVFRRRGMSDDYVGVLMDDWKDSLEEAKREADPISVMGILQPCSGP